MAAGQITHRLDGAAVADPIGWEDFTLELVRDFELRTITVKPPEKLTFHGDAWAYLRQLWASSGWCEVVQYQADEEQPDGSTLPVAWGEIFLADVEWDLTRKLATCSVADKGYGARIRNNQDFEVWPAGELTKNGTAITPPTPITIDFFDPTDPLATYLADAATGWDAFELLEHVLQTITDGGITFQSGFVDGLADAEHVGVFRGVEIFERDGQREAPAVTWGQLWTTLARLFNLWAHIYTDSDGSTIVQVEQEPTFYGTAVGLQLAHVDGVIQETDTDRLPAAVQLGDPDAEKGTGTGNSLPLLFLRGFAPDKVNLSGTCNGPDTLELGPLDMGTDSNRIEELATNASTEHADAIFLVQYVESTGKATKSDGLNPGGTPYTYNPTLENVAVLARYNLPSEGVSQQGSQDDNFLAEFTAGPTAVQSIGGLGPATYSFGQLQHDNDFTGKGFDPNNNYGNGTTQGNPVALADSRYTAPGQGYFVFTGLVRWELLTNTHTVEPSVFRTNVMSVQVKRYDASNVLQTTRTFTGEEVISTGVHELEWSAAFDLNAGDYVEVEATLESDPPAFGPIFGSYDCTFRLLNLGTFGTAWTATGGGNLPQVDPGTFRAILYKLEHHVPTSAWLSLTQDPAQVIALSTEPDGTDVRTTHVLKMARNMRTGMARLELMANRDQPFT